VRALRIASAILLSGCCAGQVAPRTGKSTLIQRTLSQGSSQVQTALDKIKPTLSGPLPALEGFVAAGESSLDQYQRPYYHLTARVSPGPSGGSLVSVTAKISAWHENPPHSRYEILQSNGRLESDLLDRLQHSLQTKPAGNANADPPPDISAPLPQLPKHAGSDSLSNATKPEDSPLEAEAKGLQEILRNQSHPTNLVAVKEDLTPLLENATTDAKVLFLASAEDEFEVLDVGPEWVHVRISGLSRGWLRRSTVEVLDGSEIARTMSASAEAAIAAGPLFSISSEEVGTFPGDWGPLKGKRARIVTVQQAAGSGRITSPQDKLQFAASVFRKEALSPDADGLVLIFDAEDGGMIASTREGLDQWRRGNISEASFWKQCLLDPPEILGQTN